MGTIMGFLDNLKGAVQDKLQPRDNDYYDDGYGDYDEPYDDGYYDDRQPQREEPRGTGLLGNPSRPDADSVNVYTRSGRHLSGDDLPSTARTARTAPTAPTPPIARQTTTGVPAPTPRATSSPSTPRAPRPTCRP